MTRSKASRQATIAELQAEINLLRLTHERERLADLVESQRKRKAGPRTPTRPRLASRSHREAPIQFAIDPASQR